MNNLNRRGFLKTSMLGAGLTAVCSSCQTTKSETGKKPNVVVIYADDLGYGDVGCYGATGVKTPNIDKLAKDGLLFKSGYCSSSTCTPSRYSMLTGKYAWRKQGTGILRGDAAMIISPKRTTLPKVMQQAGYKTAVVGKWHLGLGDGKDILNWNKTIKPGPADIGFDYSFLVPATGDRVPCVYVENHNVVNLDLKDPIEVSYRKPFPGLPTGKTHRNTLIMDWSHGHNMAIVNKVGRIGFMKGGKAALWDDRTMADTLIEKSVDFMKKQKNNPFFLYFSAHDIHVPRLPHPRFKGKSGMGPRGDAIVQFDWCVGALMKALDDLGIADDTMVIFSSDNGPVLDDGYKDQAREKLGKHIPSGPLSGSKYSILEAGTRVPFVVRWNKTIKPGVSDAIIGQVDLLASLATLTGQKTADDIGPDSLNMLPTLLGKNPKGRDWIIEHSGYLAIRKGDWKYFETYNRRKKIRKECLYNLATDLKEKKNLASENPAKVKELKTLLEKVKKAGHSRI